MLAENRTNTNPQRTFMADSSSSSKRRLPLPPGQFSGWIKIFYAIYLLGLVVAIGQIILEAEVLWRVAQESLNNVQKHAEASRVTISIASRMLREQIRPQSTPIEPLFDRECEVLTLLAQGGSNRDIADALIITEGTVKNHVSNILAKLQVESRTQATDIARRHGYA